MEHRRWPPLRRIHPAIDSLEAINRIWEAGEATLLPFLRIDAVFPQPTSNVRHRSRRTHAPCLYKDFIENAPVARLEAGQPSTLLDSLVLPLLPRVIGQLTRWIDVPYCWKRMKRKKRAATFAAWHFDDHWNAVCDFDSLIFIVDGYSIFRIFLAEDSVEELLVFFLFSTREGKNLLGSPLLVSSLTTRSKIIIIANA